MPLIESWEDMGPTEAEQHEERQPFDVLRDLASQWVMRANSEMEEAARLRALHATALGPADGNLMRTAAAHAGEYAGLAQALAAVADLYSEPITVLEEYRAPEGPLTAAIEQAKRDAADLTRTNRT